MAGNLYGSQTACVLLCFELHADLRELFDSATSVETQTGGVVNNRIQVLRPAQKAAIFGFGLGGASVAMNHNRGADHSLLMLLAVSLICSLIFFLIVFAWQGARRYLTRAERVNPLATPRNFSQQSITQTTGQEDAKEQYKRGVQYIDGEVVPRDFNEAAIYLRKAAAQGYADALYLLGIMHEGGEGAIQDIQQATSYMRKAAEQGHSEAQAWLSAADRKRLDGC